MAHSSFRMARRSPRWPAVDARSPPQRGLQRGGSVEPCLSTPFRSRSNSGPSPKGQRRDGATTYDVICRGIADDPDILALIGEAPLLATPPEPPVGCRAFPPARGHTSSPRRALRHRAVGASMAVAAAPSAATGRSLPQGDLVADFKDFCLNTAPNCSSCSPPGARRPTRSAAVPPSSPPSTSSPRTTPGQPLSLLDLGNVGRR